MNTGSLRRDLPLRSLADEAVDNLFERPGLRIERIISTGQATPEGEGPVKASVLQQLSAVQFGGGFKSGELPLVAPSRRMEAKSRSLLRVA